MADTTQILHKVCIRELTGISCPQLMDCTAIIAILCVFGECDR
jgi:hypothetical protein